MSILKEDLHEIATYKNIDWKKHCDKKTFLITGTTGLIGSFLVKALVEIGRINRLDIRILANVRDENKGRNVLKGYLDGVEFIIGDIVKGFSVEEKIDYIIHGASVTASKEMINYPVNTINVALDGTKNILEIAKLNAIDSMVYISSMEMYGTMKEEVERTKEENYGYIDHLNVRSCYPEGKKMAENMCVAFNSQYNVPVKIARLSQTFGSGVSKEENRVFAQFAKSLINEEDIILHTEGNSSGNYCYTKDSALGIFTILFEGESAQAYNVVNENTSITIREMAKLVINMSNGKCKLHFDIPEDLSSNGYAAPVKLKLSSEKLNSLGWKPTVNLKEMYGRMIESWKEQE